MKPKTLRENKNKVLQTKTPNKTATKQLNLKRKPKTETYKNWFANNTKFKVYNDVAPNPPPQARKPSKTQLINI
jgi:hypothetical protein